MQHVGEPRLFPVSLHPGPFRPLRRNLVRMRVPEIIRQHGPVTAHFHAVIDPVAPSAPCLRHIQHASHGIRRSAAPVRLDQMQPQAVRREPSRFLLLPEGEHVSGHQPGDQGQLLHGIKIIYPRCVTRLLFIRPQRKLLLYMGLPFLRRPGIQAQELPVNLWHQPQSDSNHFCPVYLDPRRGHRL